MVEVIIDPERRVVVAEVDAPATMMDKTRNCNKNKARQPRLTGDLVPAVESRLRSISPHAVFISDQVLDSKANRSFAMNRMINRTRDRQRSVDVETLWGDPLLHGCYLIPLAGSRFSSRLYAAYSPWHAIGILASIRVSFIGFQSVKTSELLVASVSKLSHLCMYRLSSPNSTLLCERLCWVTRNCTFEVTRDGFPMDRKTTLSEQGYQLIYLCDGACAFSDVYLSLLRLSASTYCLACTLHGLPVPKFRLLSLRRRQLRDEHVFVIIYAVRASYLASVMVHLNLDVRPDTSGVCINSGSVVSPLGYVYRATRGSGRIQRVTRT
ncbi:hypothetical protein M378DRAFT_157464 [Amanita muscaria Koide BX008]|uniref:Uncharacterized protein n=1 Tax=Amanita muscaria (strain Koide BX008) TaxID=946122 RepID=A0A0C2TPR7_AMAMK|nr:hypothetical protein M378DRAFT_157464 [Amanita muscaria Koide BX008]